MYLSFIISLLLIVVLADPTPTPAPILAKRACAADNCLRALRNRISTAVSFCDTYTTTTGAAIPTWASGCSANPTRVSSACGCLETGTLTKVYGPVDATKYTIYEQSVNIRSDPEPEPERLFDNCYYMCTSYGSRCQTFSFVGMASPDGTPDWGYLCYIYTTLFQPGMVEVAVNWTGNVVYQRQ